MGGIMFNLLISMVVGVVVWEFIVKRFVAKLREKAGK